jgi:hypothetical protein
MGEPRGVETHPGAANSGIASNDYAGAPRFGGGRWHRNSVRVAQIESGKCASQHEALLQEGTAS